MDCGFPRERDIDQVLNVCPDTNRCDVIADLRHTGDPESTINRIFDGTLLLGVTSSELSRVSPSLPPSHQVDLSDTDINSDASLPKFSCSQLRPTEENAVLDLTQLSDTDTNSDTEPVVSKKTQRTDINSEPEPPLNEKSQKSSIKGKSLKASGRVPPEEIGLKGALKSSRGGKGAASSSATMSAGGTGTFHTLSSSSDEELELERRPLTWSLKRRLAERQQPAVRSESTRTAPTKNNKFLAKSCKKSSACLLDEVDLNVLSERPVTPTSDGLPDLPSTSSMQSVMSEDYSTDLSSAPSVCQDTGSQDSLLEPQKKRKRTHAEIEQQKRIALAKKSEKERMRLEKLREKELAKAEKDKEKSAKQRERDAKKMEKEREMLVKRSLQEQKRQLKPGECLKYLVADIDPAVLETSGASVLLEVFAKCEVKYNIREQRIRNSILWRRTVTQHRLGEDLRVDVIEEEVEETEMLVSFQASEFVPYVETFTLSRQGLPLAGRESLRDFVGRVRAIHPEKKLTLLVQGMEKYYRGQKTAQQRKYREAVLSTDPGYEASTKGKKKKGGNTASVSRLDVEEAVLDIQLHGQCNVHLLETNEDLARIVQSFTKAVAEKPFKQDRLKSSFGFHVESSGSARVDRHGNGLLKVWKQQLVQFKNVSPEIANAICAQYPAPRLLIERYRQCLTEKEGELLLQDITVRRGFGPTENSRRIGKELSRRIYQLLTKTDPNFLIK